jgi:hypothetical protein
MDRHAPLDFGLETALEQQERLTELVDARQLVVKTAALEEWPATLRRVQSSHSATILFSESGISLRRAAPMPQARCGVRNLLRANFTEALSKQPDE